MKIILFLLRVAVAFIFVQSLFYKFSGHPEAIHIFSTIGMEPWGRYGVGIVELIVAALILLPKSVTLGAVGSIGLMLGAVYFHLFTPLGVVVEWEEKGVTKSDGGTLFFMGVAALIFGLIVLLNQYKKNPPKTFKDFIGF